MSVQPMMSVANKPPLPAGLLVVTILATVQVVVRAGFLVNFIARNTQYLSNPVLLIQSVIIPIVLMVLTAVMVVLVFSRTPAAKPFGIAVCALNLAFQLYSIGSFMLVVLSNPNFSFARNPPYLFFGLSAAYFTIFVLEIIFLALWQPRALPVAQRQPSA